MSITTQVVLKDKELEKINYFINMGYFENEKELIESALRKFLYEIGLADIRRRIPQAELSEEEVEAELEEIRRIKRETFAEEKAAAV
jgi:Arc/MetJ-type ribon-helix-helix transcriptional regulator